MTYSSVGYNMGLHPAVALAKPGATPEWLEHGCYPSPDDIASRLGGLICLELDEATLADGLKWISSVQELRWSRQAMVANILVAMRSRRLPWRRREWIRQQVTATKAVLFEVEPGEDPRDILREWLNGARPEAPTRAERVY
jgi:hypothetical protein